MKGPTGPTGLTGLLYTYLFVTIAAGLYLGVNLGYDVATTYPRLSALYWASISIVLVWAIWSIRSDLHQSEASV